MDLFVIRNTVENQHLLKQYIGTSAIYNKALL